MIYLLLLVSAITSSTSTNLYLDSPHSVQKKIPLLKVHPYSCQLVYFKVHQDQLTVTIKDIPEGIDSANLTLVFNVESLKNISKKQTVAEGVATFNFDFSSNKDLTFNQSVELNVGIDVLYNGRHSFSEQRKGYLIFMQSNADYYKVKLPIMAIIVTQLIGLICIIVLPLNVRYRKFLPFTFNLWTSLLYLIILMITLYLQMIQPNSEAIYLIQRIVVSTFSFACLILYTQDLLSFIFDRKTVVMVGCIILSAGTLACDELLPQTEDAWFLNDIIAFMVAGAFIKFVIIRRLKTAVWALLLVWIFSWFRHFAITFHLQEYDQGVGMRIVPLFLQIPKISLFDDFADYACSAFGSSKIISFGVVLNYCKRVDLYLSTHFYRVLSWTLASFCVLFELGYNIFFNDLPTMQVMSVIVFYPLVIILMLFFAEKRGEWAEIWHGSFYDMAVNRASIPRQISFDSLRRSFGEDLLLNKGSMQSD